MVSDSSKIKKILVISLSNIGDVVMTFPVVDILRADFPEAKLSLVVGPKAESLFKANPYLDKIYIYDKHQPLFEKIQWIKRLRQERCDLVVDLRNTAIPLFLGARYRTPLRRKKTQPVHMKEKHLLRLRSVYDFPREANNRIAVYVSQEDKKYVDDFLEKQLQGHDYVVVAAGAADHRKRWTPEGFAKVCDHIIEEGRMKIIFVGDADDRAVAQGVCKHMRHDAVNFCGRSDLLQLAYLIERSALALVNDSAVNHLASYLDKPVVAIFGPTDASKYGPWSRRNAVIKNKEKCKACIKKDVDGKHTCMESIPARDVMDAISIKNNNVQLKV